MVRLLRRGSPPPGRKLTKKAWRREITSKAESSQAYERIYEAFVLIETIRKEKTGDGERWDVVRGGLDTARGVLKD